MSGKGNFWTTTVKTGGGEGATSTVSKQGADVAIKGTPSTTPSTSQNDQDNNQMLDVSTSSIRNSEEPRILLTGTKLESQFLWKQPSKRRLFGAINTNQKRFFVLTPNELAYKEKDSEEQEYKVVWKIPSEVLSVEFPEINSKEFGVVVMENGASRVVKLSATDNAAAMKFANAIHNAIQKASATQIPTSAAPASTSMATTDEAEKAAGGEKIPDDLAITNGSSDSSSVKLESSQEGSAEESVATQQTVEVTEAPAAGEAVALPSDDVVSVSAVEQKSSENKSSWTWFWGACCAAD